MCQFYFKRIPASIQFIRRKDGLEGTIWTQAGSSEIGDRKKYSNRSYLAFVSARRKSRNPATTASSFILRL